MKSILLATLLFSLVIAHSKPRNIVNRSLCKRSGCVLTAEVTEGPYYFDTTLIRRNITEGYAGIPLNLNVTVIDIATCGLIENAAVDIWHANAAGVYSHFVSNENPAPTGSTFLRGIQLTDVDGTASFDTVFPGWYTGRAVHIHMKVQLNGTASDGVFTGGSAVHTGQLFFNDTFTDEVYTADATAYAKTGSRTQLTSDGIWLGSGQTGYGLISYTLPTGSISGGIAGTITVYVDKTATGQGNTPPGQGTNQPPNGTNRPSGSSSSATSTDSTSDVDNTESQSSELSSMSIKTIFNAFLMATITLMLL
eukprot:TRINITY_DN5118_c0_g1_i1.p1 TRINITY_DN5118_c0_g1~~TRINITY_DN5118_c0_g1_i1.p1  ORF type:complete len:335 (-),score=93.12 TRINITY_DN5118_c0_g1_i1:36-959(-)